ncbi:MAG: hypothetical protein ACRD5Z_03800 [Bryobacteraceae bacterium]
MRRPATIWVVVSVLALAVVAVLSVVDRQRHRFVRSDIDLVKQLPPGDFTRFYADLGALRKAGLLHLLTGVKPVQEKDYEEFVRQTEFDYTRDMEAIAGASDGEQLFFLIRGRFQWNKLKQYAAAHGGTCRRQSCTVPTSKSGYWANLVRVQPDVMGLAISANSAAAVTLRRHAPPEEGAALPSNPVWVSVSKALLTKPEALPLAMRILAISLQSADSVVLSLGPAADKQAAFAIDLEASFPIEPSAETARAQLEIETKMLKLGLQRAHKEPNPADLTGLLAAGTFRRVRKQVMGIWPVRPQLLKTLE